jgi:hypothetical protein
MRSRELEQNPCGERVRGAPHASFSSTRPNRFASRNSPACTRSSRANTGNRGWQLRTIGLALGIVTLVLGGMLVVDSVRNKGDLPCSEDNEPCGDHGSER